MQNGSNIAPNTQADDNSSTNDVFMVLSGNMEWMAIPGADAQLEEGFRMAVHELIRTFRTLGIHIRRCAYSLCYRSLAAWYECWRFG